LFEFLRNFDLNAANLFSVDLAIDGLTFEALRAAGG